MSSSVWDDIKKNVSEGVTFVSKKTDEYTRIGKLKVDILSINRNLDKAFTDLGRGVYRLLNKAGKEDITKNDMINKLVSKIKTHEKALEARKKEIEKVKKESSSKTEKETVKPEKRKTKQPAGKKATSTKK